MDATAEAASNHGGSLKSLHHSIKEWLGQAELDVHVKKKQIAALESEITRLKTEISDILLEVDSQRRAIEIVAQNLKNKEDTNV